MITVTDKAKQELKKTLLDHTDEPEFGVRLTLGPAQQILLVLDREAPDDHVVEHEGSKVLLVEPQVASLLAEATLDTEDTPDGPKLVMHRE